MFSAIPEALNSEEPECRVVLEYQCSVEPIYGNIEMETFARDAVIKRRKQELPNYDKLEKEGNLYFGTDRIYIVDLNKDNIPEYIVPYQCGAVGNCSYVIFADHPPRILGEIGAEYIIFTPVKDEWPDIMVYGHASGFEGDICKYRFTDGQYRQDISATIYVTDHVDKNGKRVHTKTDFFKQLGPVKCECEKGK